MCRRVVLEGEVSKGAEWKAALGEGWVFRLVPIAGFGYSGWDLVVDRTGLEAGYPDALLLATPPYGSINEREIGTTFGLRAQDALGWEPRRFRFLNSAEELKRGRVLFRKVSRGDGPGDGGSQADAAELLRMVAHASPGEFEVGDAKLIEGTGDAKPFAQRWAENFKNVPHTIVQDESGGRTEGEIRWVRFRVTLWLPKSFLPAAGVRSGMAKCSQ